MPENLQLMNTIDRLYTDHPFLGSRRLAALLQDQLGRAVNRKKVQRLMRKMGLEAIYPKPNLSRRSSEHEIYPYLLSGLSLEGPNQVWSSDITYIPMVNGFVYLTAVIDWFSRYVLSWRLSNTLDSHFCVEALEAALELGCPEIHNSDQGSQYTSHAFVNKLKAAKIKISMDGKGRAIDNVFVERLWRSVKYEYVYLRIPESVPELYQGLINYFDFYNKTRPHQSLGYRTPLEMHFSI